MGQSHRARSSVWLTSKPRQEIVGEGAPGSSPKHVWRAWHPVNHSRTAIPGSTHWPQGVRWSVSDKESWCLGVRWWETASITKPTLMQRMLREGATATGCWQRATARNILHPLDRKLQYCSSVSCCIYKRRYEPLRNHWWGTVCTSGNSHSQSPSPSISGKPEFLHCRPNVEESSWPILRKMPLVSTLPHASCHDHYWSQFGSRKGAYLLTAMTSRSRPSQPSPNRRQCRGNSARARGSTCGSEKDARACCCEGSIQLADSTTNWRARVLPE